MNIEARLDNSPGHHAVTVATAGNTQIVAIAARAGGSGSSLNGGELLCLALATCYCNDVYREAGQRSLEVERVEVHAHAEFGGVGEPARALHYTAAVTARASRSEIEALMRHVDTVAEIQNTLRQGMEVRFDGGTAVEAEPSGS